MKPYLYAAATGILLSLAMPYWGFAPIAFVALFPLFYFLDGRPKLKTVICGALLIQIIYSGLTLFWIPPTLVKIWDYHLATAWLSLFVFSLFNQLQLLVFSVGYYFTPSKIRNSYWSVLGFSIFFGGLYLVPNLLNDVLANCLYRFHGFISLFHFPHGTSLLTTVIFAVSYLGYFLLKRRRVVWGTSLLIGAVVICAQYPPPQSSLSNEKKELDIVAVNTRIEPDPKNQIAFSGAVHSLIMKTLSEVSPSARPQIIVFPETTMAQNIFETIRPPYASRNKELLSLIQQNGLHVFIGAAILENKNLINALLYIHPGVTSADIEYIPKRILFPFGERIPLADTLPFLKHIFPDSHLSDQSNVTARYFSAFGVRIAPALCYEAIFPDFLRPLQNSVDLVINPSNEWAFPQSGEPELSFALSVFSAVENRLPIVRVSNAGIGGLISKSGEIVDSAQVRGEVDIRRYHLTFEDRN
jgi:apolipoprotein N-acyltransferase